MTAGVLADVAPARPDVAALVKLMVDNGLTRIVCDGVTIERPLPPPPAPRGAPLQSDFDAFRQMSEDKRDAIMHGVMGGVTPRMGVR